MVKKIGLLIRTLSYLKPIQVLYQLKQRIIKPKTLSHYLRSDSSTSIFPLALIPFPSFKDIADSSANFTFLNLSKKFSGAIQWNFMEYGKLWNYNLQYLHFVNQENIHEAIRLKWMRDIYQNLFTGKLALEPYPSSLRIMNLIRFLNQRSAKQADYKDIILAVEAELNYLNQHYEYHILANHLLENAFAMLMGAYFYNNRNWKNKAIKIIKAQLNEQILKDGAHYELSPMYHQIILFRVLEVISYLPAEDSISFFFTEKASLMLGWLKTISFKNGDIPHFNDSANHIAFHTNELISSAALLGIHASEIKLNESGYRKCKNEKYDCIVDVKGIFPTYQPGHNHSDHLSFVLQVNNEAFMVDPGTSTYTISTRRQWERSSKAHNTVTIDDKDQSEVWGGFRVGRRAIVNCIHEQENYLKACASYKLNYKTSVFHVREFYFENNEIQILDEVNTQKLACARFYLHPDVKIKKIEEDKIVFHNGIILNFAENSKVIVNEYDFALGFNQLARSLVIEAYFNGKCSTMIKMNFNECYEEKDTIY